MKEYRIENIEAYPSSKWFWGDVEGTVTDFFYFKLLTATSKHSNSGIFSVVPERGRTFLLRIDDIDSFTFLRKDGVYEEGVVDYGVVTARSIVEGNLLFFAEGEFMERYRFFCTEMQTERK